MSQKLDPSIKRAITAFANAAELNAFVGSYEPAMRPHIEENFARRRANLEKIIAIKIEAARK